MGMIAVVVILSYPRDLIKMVEMRLLTRSYWYYLMAWLLVFCRLWVSSLSLMSEKFREV